MRALHIDDGRVHFTGTWAAPAVPPGRGGNPDAAREEPEVVVRVLQAGICATDLALARGYMDFAGVPGHEFVGRAEDGPLAGRRVVGEINAACGTCPACRGGTGRHCPNRTVLGILGRDGAFAERLALPAANLHEVPDGVSDDQAVFVEPLAAAFAIGEQVDLARHRRVLVVGDGRLGLLVAQVLARAGLEVDLAGRHPERVAILPAGISHLGDFLAQGRPGERWELVVEASGDPDVLPRLLPHVAPRGTLVLKTTAERPTTLDLAPLVVDEVRLVGSRCGPFAPALAALADGSVRVESMIEARYPLEEGVRAFEHAGRRGTLKVLIDPS